MAKFKVGDRVRYRATMTTFTRRLEGKEGVIYRGDSCVKFDDGEVVDYLLPGNLELAPATTSPVRERTVTEIVPGAYGRVLVNKPYQARVGVSLDTDSSIFYLNPAELRAAAATFLELAGALEQANG